MKRARSKSLKLSALPSETTSLQVEVLIRRATTSFGLGVVPPLRLSRLPPFGFPQPRSQRPAQEAAACACHSNRSCSPARLFPASFALLQVRRHRNTESKVYHKVPMKKETENGVAEKRQPECAIQLASGKVWGRGVERRGKVQCERRQRTATKRNDMRLRPIPSLKFPLPVAIFFAPCPLLPEFRLDRHDRTAAPLVF